MAAVSHLLFGQMERVDGGEYRDFQYRLLVLLLVVSPFFVGSYLAVYQAMVGGIHGMYFWVMVIHMPLSWGLWGLLRGHPARMLPVAWAFELATLNLCLMALCYGVADELRILWFYLNIPAVFIVFGIRIGWMLTLLNSVFIVAANALSGAPYSALALVNGVNTALYLGVMFHVLLWRTQLFYRRMQAHNQELKRLASHDALTGLMNAGAFHAACESIIRLSQRHRSPFAVLFIDLDHFKKVNDTHGHAVGDEVLRTAARAPGWHPPQRRAGPHRRGGVLPAAAADRRRRRLEVGRNAAASRGGLPARGGRHGPASDCQRRGIGLRGRASGLARHPEGRGRGHVPGQAGRAQPGGAFPVRPGGAVMGQPLPGRVGPQPQRLHEQRERRRRMAPVRVVQVVPFESLAPVAQHLDQLA